MNQSFSKIWIIAILAVFIAGGFFAWQYFSTQKTEVKSPEQQNTQDKTADWKIYLNEEYGFEIKYPSGTQITDIDAKTGWFFLTLPSSPTDAVSLQLDIRVNVSNNCPSDTNISYISINRVNFSKTDKSGDFAGMEGRAVATDYCVVRNNKVYELITRISYGRDNPPSQPDIQKGSKILNQILSTFRFLPFR